MPPRILQWLPVDAFDEVFLVPRAGQEDAFVRRLGAFAGIARVEQIGARVYASGTNIDGGWIDVGDARPIARLVELPIEELARTVAELIDFIEPTRFLVRDYDGARAVHVAEDIEILDLADWRTHVVREGEHELVVAAITEPIEARGPRPDDLEDLEGLVALVPEQLEPHLLVAKLYLQLDRLDDAARAATAALQLDVRDWQKAPARSVLGEVAHRRGDVRAAYEEHAAAAALRRTPATQVALGVAAIRANETGAAWSALAPHDGRTMFDVARSMCAIGRLGDARAFLRIALDLDPKLLQPVPANQYPKPPDTAWTAPHPELAALVGQVATS